MKRAIWLIVIALCACKGDEKRKAPRSSASPPVTQASVVIRDVRVFDGAQVIASTDVALLGETVAAIGPGLVVSPEAVVIAGAGKTLLPGLIDAHAHVHDGRALEQALAFGVTTELGMFSIPADAAKLKAENLPSRADLRSAGTLATAPGSHGTQYGLGIATLTRPDEAQAFVDARIAEGSDYLKIVYEDGSSFGMTLPTIDAPTLKALIDAAHARRRLAVVHISEYDRRAPRSTAAPTGSCTGPISGFDDGTLAVRFGQVWEPSTDEMIGGASTVTLAVVDRALRLAGEVKPGAKPEAWAGAMFMPGPSPFAPVALSRTQGLAFSATRVTGTGGVAVMVFTKAGGYTPAHRVVPLGATPTRVQVSWQDLGLDPKDVTGIFLGRDTPGAFALVIDDVALE